MWAKEVAVEGKDMEAKAKKANISILDIVYK